MQRKTTKSDVPGRSRPHRSIRNRSALLAFALSLSLTPTLLLPVPVAAAQQRGPIERTVDGKVTGKTDAPISGAVVYLKDSKSLAVKSYLTDQAGEYRFGQLSQNTDYEIWAELNGEHSKSKHISSFDNRNDFHFDLKINPK